MKNVIFICCAFFLMAACYSQTKSTKEMKNYSTEIIRYTIPADKHADFENAYAQAGAYLKQSPFCMSYQLLHGEEEPHHYILVIRWTSKDDHLNGFRKSMEFTEFFKLVRPFYENIEEMKHYNLTNIAWKK